MNNRELIKEFCLEIGLDTIGITKCRVFEELRDYYNLRKEKKLENEFEEKDIEKRINPFLYMEGGRSIISIAFPYAYDSLPSEDKIYFSKYTMGQDYHKVVKSYLLRICEFIEGIGGKTVMLVDSNSLPERYLAKISGVGFIGKNNMIITKKYGSYVFLGEIITDLDLHVDIPIDSECKGCKKCGEVCPTEAIGEHNKSNLCLSYLTQKKELDENSKEMLRGRLFGCDSCQICCPHNFKISFSKIEEFKPYDFMKNINLEELCNLDKKTFKEKYIKTSCGWRGKNILKRNAIANINFAEKI